MRGFLCVCQDHALRENIKVLEVIGRGCSSYVQKVRRIDTGEYLALKVSLRMTKNPYRLCCHNPKPFNVIFLRLSISTINQSVIS